VEADRRGLEKSAPEPQGVAILPEGDARNATDSHQRSRNDDSTFAMTGGRITYGNRSEYLPRLPPRRERMKKGKNNPVYSRLSS